MSEFASLLLTLFAVTVAVAGVSLLLLALFAVFAQLNGGDADYEAERADDERSAGHYLEDA